MTMKRRHSEVDKPDQPRSSPSAGSSSQGEGGMADTETDAGPSRSNAGPSSGGHRERPPSDLTPPPVAKKKRTRTLTTPHQSAVLHALLAQSRFPTTAMREEVGRSIGLSARKVQVWFQNQRQKARRPRSQSAAAPLTRPPQYESFSNEPSASSAGYPPTAHDTMPGPSRIRSARPGYPPPEPIPYGAPPGPSSSSAAPLTGPGMPGPSGSYMSRYPPPGPPPTLSPAPPGFTSRPDHAEQWTPIPYHESPTTSRGYTFDLPPPRGRGVLHGPPHDIPINLPPLGSGRGRSSSASFPLPSSAQLPHLGAPHPSAFISPGSPPPHRFPSRSGSFQAPHPPLPPLHVPSSPYGLQPAPQWGSSSAFSSGPPPVPRLRSPISPLLLRPRDPAPVSRVASPGLSSPVIPAPESPRVTSPRPPARRTRFDPVRAAQDENISGASAAGAGPPPSPRRTTRRE